jgi:multidrug efflux system membrane fusion protein
MNAQSLRWASLLPVATLLGCAEHSSHPPEPPPVPVRVTVAAVKTVPVQARVIGTVKAVSTVSVRPQVGGQLTEVHFKEGDYVKKGQKLFTIDPRPYEVAVKEAKANLAKSEALLVGAERILARVVRLSGAAVSAEEIDAARTAAASARAVVAADAAALNSAQLQANYTTITSPLDGRTGGLLVTAGNLVGANDANPLVVVKQVSPINVTFALPERQLPAVATARRERPLKVEAFLRNGEPPAAGVLAFIDNAVDAGTGTVQLKAEFRNEDRKLWPGQFVDVVLTIRERPGSVVVPVEAVQSGQQGEYVFVVTPEKTAEMRRVTVGFEVGGEAVIASGLDGGETVVLAGQLRLAPGARVAVKDAPVRSAGAAPGDAPRSAGGRGE